MPRVVDAQLTTEWPRHRLRRWESWRNTAKTATAGRRGRREQATEERPGCARDMSQSSGMGRLRSIERGWIGKWFDGVALSEADGKPGVRTTRDELRGLECGIWRHERALAESRSRGPTSAPISRSWIPADSEQPRHLSVRQVEYEQREYNLRTRSPYRWSWYGEPQGLRPQSSTNEVGGHHARETRARHAVIRGPDR